MLREAMVWSILMTKVGNLRKQGEQLESFFRYFVIDSLAREGFFDYLQKPRTYSEISNEFGFADTDYAHSLLNVLIKEKSPLVMAENGHFRRVPGAPLPDLAQIADQSVQHIRKFSHMAQGMAKYVLPRLRKEVIEFTDTFQENGRQLLTKFDMTLGSDVYTNLRRAAFAFLPRRDKERARGGQLLEVGCGNGRETAEIWLYFGGDIHITAIDPVDGLLNLARERFSSYLEDMQPAHPPLTLANRPSFNKFGALELPFADSTFDAVFHAFVLHWTPNPAHAICEIARVLKPGGVVFGVQPVKPAAGAYFDLVVRTSDSYGFFTSDDLRKWYAAAGIEVEAITPLAIFRGQKPTTARKFWLAADAYSMPGGR